MESLEGIAADAQSLLIYRSESNDRAHEEESMWPFEKRKVAKPQWSNDPMCFERHLARKLGNPLFPASERRITTQELEAARARDKANAASFRRDFEEHLAWGLSFKGRDFNVKELGDYFRRTLELMERIAQIGGCWDEEMKVLQNVAHTAKHSLSEAQRDAEASNLLDRYEALCRMIIGIPLVAQSQGPHSPFQSDTDAWLRAVLSEDDWQIERCGTWAGAMGLPILDRADRICREAVRDGFPSFEARRKLGILQQAYESGRTLEHIATSAGTAATATEPDPEGKFGH